MVVLDHVTELRAGVRADAATGFTDAAVFVLPALELKVEPFLGVLLRESVLLERECQDFCVWGGYSRGSPTRLPFVFEMQYARPDAIARVV